MKYIIEVKNPKSKGYERHVEIFLDDMFLQKVTFEKERSKRVIIDIPPEGGELKFIKASAHGNFDLQETDWDTLIVPKVVIEAKVGWFKGPGKFLAKATIISESFFR